MLGVDCSKMDGPTVPIVYSVSFSDPAGYFLATRMQMHNKDVIFAANAQAVEITKFATFINTLDRASRLISGQSAHMAEFADHQRDRSHFVVDGGNDAGSGIVTVTLTLSRQVEIAGSPK